MPCPFQGQFVIHRLGLAMTNRHTKFEVSMFNHYKYMKSNTKSRNWGGFGSQGSPKVTIWYSAYDFICNFNRNCTSNLYGFRVIASYLSKVAYFNLPHLHLAPPLGVTLFEFRQDLWHQKTRVRGHTTIYGPLGLCPGLPGWVGTRNLDYWNNR